MVPAAGSFATLVNAAICSGVKKNTPPPVVRTAPILRLPSQLMVVLAVVGPVARPDETVNGFPLCQTPRTPSSHPPVRLSSQRGILVPKRLPRPQGRL